MYQACERIVLELKLKIMDQLEGLQQTTTTNLGAVTDRQTY